MRPTRFIAVAAPSVVPVLHAVGHAQQTADDADSRAANAQQMVRNDRPKLEAVQAEAVTLAGLAADYQKALTASLADRAALRAMVEALQAQGIIAQTRRVTSTSALTIGATVNLTVTWDKAWADTRYLVIPTVDATAGVVDVTAPQLRDGTKTTTQCVVSFKVNASLLAAVNVNVIGLRLG